MTELHQKYELVIGLEVHAQLSTKSKLFCGDSASYGGDPNTHISPITLAYPGTLPKLNKQAVEFAIRMGLACNSAISPVNWFARKHYFYPDLPKGYQTSQHINNICQGGGVKIVSAGQERVVALHHIHLEEDAGKSIHDAHPLKTAIDHNRAGVPLIEIVSEPDLFSAEEAYAYVTEIRKLVRFLGICDGNMEEGSLRCDANISIRPRGDKKLGTRVEVKNLNSIRNVKRAIEYEAERMMEMAEKGEPIIQQTRSFDADKGTTFALRSKEEANDYRYFPDPDLPPFVVTPENLERIKSAMPELPDAVQQRFMQQYQLPAYDARLLSDEKDLVDYFEAVLAGIKEYKSVANWLLGPVKGWLNENNLPFDKFPLPPSQLARLVELVASGKISFSSASSRLLPRFLETPDADPAELAATLNLLQNAGSGEIEQWVAEVLGKMPDKVAEYKKGKKGLIGLFMGEVKKISKGKADPKMTTTLLEQKLNEQ
ncbi:Asp-tRNA(Asn)/Glu-tRNA(Gln) amidotransferase subunit GatB [Flavihumibacter profundi]|uniref:Asp-tRNA(Asn)/Glu-tRNA(Gln) amidotransferase subunit GatB n=1 Tax=Flavihumibacter profundi TaxID=2716883 RepID=UPI001CC77CF2|nr:Asp-tRNA(Asn)/Glu-tRNA(Gln) amidotransferase subunit GatB [Flavihumibacter profundi]MBZ5858621.1 Asp-tRNA(Asn)/Glu-tRNA(Gln) amidotransferase subunit GatB [Flavihumibacter profundi]